MCAYSGNDHWEMALKLKSDRMRQASDLVYKIYTVAKFPFKDT